MGKRITRLKSLRGLFILFIVGTGGASRPTLQENDSNSKVCSAWSSLLFVGVYEPVANHYERGRGED